MDATRLVASTPRGSTIEALGEELYRVCDHSRHCRLVNGLWQAQELVQQVELLHRHPEELGEGALSQEQHA